jgi:hypothetical protein
MPYKIDYYHYTGDSRDSKKNDYSQSSQDRHKRSKSQTINSIKGRKGNSTQENSVEEVSHLLQKHFQQNNKTAYNLVNEYLENPSKLSNITVTGSSTGNLEGKPVNRSRGKRVQSNIPNTGIIHKGKRINPNNASLLKKIAFKSFDKRRAGTNLDRREGSFDDPLSFLRSSSACHKYTYEKVSAGGKKSNRASKTSTTKNKKIRQSHNVANYSKVSANNAMCRFMKPNKIR